MKLLPIFALLSSLALIAAANTACVPSAYSRPTATASARATLEVTHDKFRPDADMVKLSVPDAVQGTVGPSGRPLSASFNILVLARPPQGSVVTEDVYFSFSSVSSDSWQYLKCHSLNFLVDGQPVPVGETDHDGSVGRGYVIEYVRFQAPLSLIERMGQARSVEAKICNTEFTFKPETLRLMRDFASTVRTGVVPQQPVDPREGTLGM